MTDPLFVDCHGSVINRSVQLKNLVGERFGRLVVVERSGSTPKGGARWLCRCDCGSDATVAAGNLRGGSTRSCGCLGSELSSARAATHRMSKTPTYVSWSAMIQRCTNPKAHGAHNYSGRGIGVCERWRSFENFLSDMGERPAGATLDRFPDGDGNYEPANCRWATKTEQARNARYTKLTPDMVQEIHGRCEHGESMHSVARRFGIGAQAVHKIRHGVTWKDQLAGPT